jgi:hypothetical protein
MLHFNIKIFLCVCGFEFMKLCVYKNNIYIYSVFQFERFSNEGFPFLIYMCGVDVAHPHTLAVAVAVWTGGHPVRTRTRTREEVEDDDGDGEEIGDEEEPQEHGHNKLQLAKALNDEGKWNEPKFEEIQIPAEIPKVQ